MTNLLRVGGATIEHGKALEFAEKYLANKEGTWAYPAYDGYPGHPGREIGRADLLAVALLNAHQAPIESYYGLESLIDDVNERLEALTSDERLETADQPLIDRVARLFGVLDKRRPKHVSLTKLSKVLHRKRPGLIPLYDKNIRRCYVELGSPPPVLADPERSWEDYAKVLLPAIQHDLTSQLICRSCLGSSVIGVAVCS
ncbi:DUF6308 family protein [Arthrobacter cavernae]|uniref:Uncharacterized protein n=1 Tax=Arthrobacter cavernae TaxID=2817681 RepID=A0A939HCJ8_9MICC|nr:DUF6308 family protein [Arthrobacter cavernae]MBO1266659.1 hypothetical protein [Arthrobacter cavernae]